MIGVSLMIITTLLWVANQMTLAAEHQMSTNTAAQAVDRLKVEADFVYIHGHPTRTTVHVKVPPGVDGDATYINGQTINIGMEVGGDGHNDLYAVTKGNLLSRPNLLDEEGYYVLIVESTPGGDINISKKD